MPDRGGCSEETDLRRRVYYRQEVHGGCASVIEESKRHLEMAYEHGCESGGDLRSWITKAAAEDQWGLESSSSTVCDTVSLPDGVSNFLFS